MKRSSPLESVAHPLEKKLKISFQQPNLLRQALIHRSLTKDTPQPTMHNNERLEYLGDAVLELAVSDYLYQYFPQADEGFLTQLRAALVRKESLATAAKKISLGQWIQLSYGEEQSGGREKDYILANALEAVLGAVYVDQGLTVAAHLVERLVLPLLPKIVQKQLHKDAKSRLQEMTQEQYKLTPSYLLIQESGPDHAKEFTMGVLLAGDLLAKGKGPSKQKAEEEAARRAVLKLEKQLGKDEDQAAR